MNNLSDQIYDILNLTYNIYNLRKSYENNKIIKKIFINQLKTIYYELQNFNVESYIENDASTSKYGIIKLATVLDSFIIPGQGDFLTHIYNKSDFNIKFGIYIQTIRIAEFDLAPKQSVYPLFNNAILPLYLLTNGVRIIFYNQVELNQKRQLALIYRDLDDSNRGFLRLYSNNICYYVMNNSICNIIENGKYTEYNVDNVKNYLHENDVCFDKNIIKFCIEI